MGKGLQVPLEIPQGLGQEMPFSISSLGPICSFCILMRKSSPVGSLLVNAKLSVMARNCCLRDRRHFIDNLPLPSGEGAE